MKPKLTQICLLIALVPGFATVALGAATAPVTNILTLTGTVQTGVAVVGGETTGIQLTSAGVTYELEIKSAELKKKAEELNGKAATVKGTLTIKQGVERGQRLIIAVEMIAAVPATTKP